MFDRIAGRYDLMNSVMTAGCTIAGASARPTSRASARATARSTSAAAPATSRSSWRGRVGPRGRVVGLDFSAPMLELARAKSPERRGAGRLGAGQRARAAVRRRRVRCRHGRLRRPQRGRPRARRSPRWRAWCGPAGRVVILEITTPRRPPLSWFYAVWFDRIVPLLGTVGGRPRRLQLPAGLRAALPARRRARGADARRRPARRPLPAAGRRHRRDPLGHGRRRMSTRRRRRRSARSAARAAMPRA